MLSGVFKIDITRQGKVKEVRQRSKDFRKVLLIVPFRSTSRASLDIYRPTGCVDLDLHVDLDSRSSTVVDLSDN